MQSTQLATKSETLKVIQQLKECDQDFEFYPSTEAQLSKIKDDIKKQYQIDDEKGVNKSVLDCGAGMGAALNQLTNGSKYAIEKSQPLLNQLNENIFILGTDFDNQTLIDKPVDICFSNPPFSMFSSWAEKIIKEANASLVYLIIPARWEDDKAINEALKLRDATVEIIDKSHFGTGSGAFRETRYSAEVHTLRIDLANINTRSYYNNRDNSALKVDPFELWFNSNFGIKQSMEAGKPTKETVKKTEDIKNSRFEVIKSEGLVKALEGFYNKELDNLMQNYIALGKLDPVLLKELNVTVEGVLESLKLKIKGLKNIYWRELFDNLDTITNRLTSECRQNLLNTLFANTSVEFTATNAHSIVLWIIKNANSLFDKQVVNVFDRMTEKKNIKKYKSNKKVFGDQCWRYNNRPSIDVNGKSLLSHYKLEYRILLTSTGGITSDYGKIKLTNSAKMFLSDILIVAQNLGFDATNKTDIDQLNWDSGKKNNFMFLNHNTGKLEVLFEIKGFWNGNLHFRFCQDFMIRLNTEIGRIKKWVRTPREAAEELDITMMQANQSFSSNLKIENNAVQLLLNSAA